MVKYVGVWLLHIVVSYIFGFIPGSILVFLLAPGGEALAVAGGLCGWALLLVSFRRHRGRHPSGAEA